MPPKKKAKKTQTVSLDKRTQAKLLRGGASAIEAEATVEERIHELLEFATTEILYGPLKLGYAVTGVVVFGICILVYKTLVVGTQEK